MARSRYILQRKYKTLFDNNPELPVLPLNYYNTTIDVYRVFNQRSFNDWKKTIEGQQPFQVSFIGSYRARIDDVGGAGVNPSLISPETLTDNISIPKLFSFWLEKPLPFKPHQMMFKINIKPYDQPNDWFLSQSTGDIYQNNGVFYSQRVALKELNTLYTDIDKDAPVDVIADDIKEVRYIQIGFDSLTLLHGLRITGVEENTGNRVESIPFFMFEQAEPFTEPLFRAGPTQNTKLAIVRYLVSRDPEGFPGYGRTTTEREWLTGEINGEFKVATIKRERPGVLPTIEENNRLNPFIATLLRNNFSQTSSPPIVNDNRDFDLRNILDDSDVNFYLSPIATKNKRFHTAEDLSIPIIGIIDGILGIDNKLQSPALYNRLGGIVNNLVYYRQEINEQDFIKANEVTDETHNEQMVIKVDLRNSFTIKKIAIQALTGGDIFFRFFNSNNEEVDTSPLRIRSRGKIYNNAQSWLTELILERPDEDTNSFFNKK